MAKCSIDGCNKKSVCLGFCGMHHTRFRRHGDPLITKKKSYSGVKCSHVDCEKQANWNGWCARHAMRIQRYGNADYVTPEDERRRRCREAQPRLGQLKPTTYTKYLGRHLHRQIAENKLGRPLRFGEIVHHIDGDKRNNDPSNLEVLIDQSRHAKRHKVPGRAQFVSKC